MILDEIDHFRISLENIVSDINKITKIDSNIRNEYLRTVEDGMSLLDGTLQMVILQFNEVLDIRQDKSVYPGFFSFKKALSRINYRQEWLDKERALRLCQNLRQSLFKTQGILGELKGKIALADAKSVNDFLNEIFPKEDELADFISRKLTDVAEAAKKSGDSQGEIDQLTKLAEDTRDAFHEEKVKLMRFQVAIEDAMRQK
jgi:hypothetical protein